MGEAAIRPTALAVASLILILSDINMPELSGLEPRSVKGPGCVKTCTSKECAELFSLFSSFDDDCQSGSFLIQTSRNVVAMSVSCQKQPSPRSFDNLVSARLQ
jgi:hypothetical protein